MRRVFPNGSSYFFIGAETRAEIEKLRGGSFDLIVIDECKSYPPELLGDLLNDVCVPAISDRDGSILMIGTPGSILEGPFYEATYKGAINPRHKDKRPFSRTYDDPEPFWQNKTSGWLYSRHSWTVQDNVYKPNVWKTALETKEDQGWDDDHPTWLREWLGHWINSDDAFVYKYATLVHSQPDKVTWHPDRQHGNKHGLPNDHDYRYVVGMDLGFEDDFALCVGAYSLTSGHLYHVYDMKMNHQDVYQVADHFSRMLERFDDKVDAAVADASGLGKMVIETLNRRHGFQIQPAEKREKYDFIELLNADFLAGKVKIQPDSDLATELRILQWDLTKHTKGEQVKSGRLKEHPGLPNHLCDAWLYLWRYSYHTYGQPAGKTLTRGSTEWFEQWEKESIEKMMMRQYTDRSNDLYDKIQANSVDPLEGHYRANRSGRS